MILQSSVWPPKNKKRSLFERCLEEERKRERDFVPRDAAKFPSPPSLRRLQGLTIRAVPVMVLGGLLRCRRHTCKVVLLTSLAWCMLDLLVLVTYSDCSNGIGWGCSSGQMGAGAGGGGAGGGKHRAIKFARQVADEKEEQVRRGTSSKQLVGLG